MRTTSVTTGSILSRSFGLFGAGFVPFISISLLVHSPLLLWNLGRAATGNANPAAELLEAFLSNLLLAPLASAALIYGVFRSLRGEGSTIGECLRVGLSRWISVLILALLVGLAVFGATLAFIIPGLVVASGLFVAVPALVVEELPIGPSFGRSWQLTKDYKFTLFGVLLLLGVLGWTIGAILGLLTAGAEALAPVISFIGLLLTVALSTVQAIAAAVAYHDLRVHKEGLDEEELASVFE